MKRVQARSSFSILIQLTSSSLKGHFGIHQFSTEQKSGLGKQPLPPPNILCILCTKLQTKEHKKYQQAPIMYRNSFLKLPYPTPSRYP